MADPRLSPGSGPADEPERVSPLEPPRRLRAFGREPSTRYPVLCRVSGDFEAWGAAEPAPGCSHRKPVSPSSFSPRASRFLPNGPFSRGPMARAQVRLPGDTPSHGPASAFPGAASACLVWGGRGADVVWSTWPIAADLLPLPWRRSAETSPVSGPPVSLLVQLGNAFI